MNNQTSTFDRNDYKAVMNAMSTLGLTHMETQTMWNIVAGVLHLVSFWLFNLIYIRASRCRSIKHIML